MTAELEKFFTAYGHGLSGQDPEVVVPFYGYPCIMLTDTFAGAVSSADELRLALSQGDEFYQQFGVTGVHHEIQGIDVVTEKISRVRLRWHYDKGTEELFTSDYEYLIRTETDAPHIYVVVSKDEEVKIAEMAQTASARRGS